MSQKIEVFHVNEVLNKNAKEYIPTKRRNKRDEEPTIQKINLKKNGEDVTNLDIPATYTYNDKNQKVTQIGNSAFAGYELLTSVTIPDSVTFIGRASFYNCSSLKSITIPNSVTGIYDDAFCDCESLTNLIIPNSVTKIGDDAFENIPHIEYHGTATGAPWGAKSMN